MYVFVCLFVYLFVCLYVCMVLSQILQHVLDSILVLVLMILHNHVSELVFGSCLICGAAGFSFALFKGK